MNSDMKRAIIIGATSGIGREVAKQLLLQGWRLGIAGRRLPDAFRIFAELSWADIYNSEGLDYKEYTNKQKDSFAIFRSKKIFKFRITQKYRCSGKVVNGVFHVLMFDLTHKLSD